MNERKICFISCVNEHNAYAECVSFIQALDVPEGFEIDVVSIESAGSMTEGYQAAMSESDAKYKVYLHQDVLIINKSFISDVIRIFEQQPKVGLLGVAGTMDIPPNGVWWESWNRVGKLYESHTGKMELLALHQVEGFAQPVAALDGLLLITQYDVPWNTRDFDGWHFYDLSQCMEFRRHGYEAAVAAQDSPWCIHDCGIVNVRNGFDLYRQRYLSEYGKELFPLVSVLIPTYNRPELFELALQSVLQQTYPHIEIVICDDSSDNDTANLMQSYLQNYSHVRYYKNEKNLGQFENDLKLMELAEGEYVNFLMDDDLFHPRKIEKMMKYYLMDSLEEISLVTSHRQIIDENGTLMQDVGSTKRIFKQDTMVHGKLFGNQVLAIEVNVIGEPTTVLFRKKHLKEPFGSFMNRPYICNVDLATWANLLAVGNMVYISETLSFFRIHSGQQLASRKMVAGGALDSAHMVAHGREKGFFANVTEYRKHIEEVLQRIDNVLKAERSDETAAIVKELAEYREILRNRLTQDSGIPLVSVVIPAYNRPHYLELALQSVLNQTYPNIEIVISDDSTNNEVEEMLQPYLARHRNIRYVHNETPKVNGNFQQCLDMATGKYVNYLMDDDLFHPDKVERMVDWLERNPNATMATSFRELIDDKGERLVSEKNKKMFEEDTVVDGRVLAEYCLVQLSNHVGEPSTVMFRKADVQEFSKYNGLYFRVINDLATWIYLMTKGDVVYLASPLSYFRQHEGQNQNDVKRKMWAIRQWYNLIESARETGLFSNEENHRIALVKHLDMSVYILKEVYQKIGLKSFTDPDVRQVLTEVTEQLTRELETVS